MRSRVVERLLARAQREWEAQDLDAAQQALTSALALAPGDPDATRRLGMVVQQRGEHRKAVACFRAVLPVWPDDADLLTGLGLSLFTLDEVEEATVYLQRACTLAAGSASTWFNLGEALWRRGRPADAQARLERALELDPAYFSAWLSLARVHASLGRTDAALHAFREVLRYAPEHPDAWYGLALNGAHFTAVDVDSLRRAFAREGLPARNRELLGFTLARALEDQHDYPRAFDLLDHVNALQHAHVQWDAAAEHARIASIRSAFAAPAAAPVDPHAGSAAILIVSMPRSGSTLVEHILASHPQVEGANEIKDLRQIIDAEGRRRAKPFPAWAADATPADWQRLGADYLARTARWRASKPRFTDKNLKNWQYVGAALAMLPAARVVVVRRDPVETCLACYRHCFTEEAAFACSLADLAGYCADFLGLTRFWLQRFPARVFDLQYERLVADPEAEVRRLLEFCGLPFAPQCLAFYDTPRAVLTPSASQVREPIRHDTARSQRYGDKLDALRAHLARAGVSFGT